MILRAYDYLCTENCESVRYFFDIAYNGTAYHGWQSQNNALGIQQVIEEKLFLITQKQIDITGSGRTDTGVHAIQQIFHADFAEQINTGDLRFHLNSVLPNDIMIREIMPVHPEAHARFDACQRTYQYRIIGEKNPFQRKQAYHYRKSMRLDALNEAASYLIGKHDFQAFSKVKTDVNNYFCQINQSSWQLNESVYCFNISADRFLRGMVRAIVGTLLLVNEEKLDVMDIEQIILSRDRQKAGRSVPPEGLYLMKVEYPAEIFI
ncbi:MAG: tRNA pseudouridine(38-40) synthase TruA [Cyclobacteriaceae bacterium]|nr:tRNA pseudouridine(38-40) synthase TruA [Cyclobacteriaceae bacterium]